MSASVLLLGEVSTTLASLQMLFYLVLLLVVPIVLGMMIARWLRMPDYGWKLGLILVTLFVSVGIVYLRWPPKLGIDLKGGVKLIYEVDQASKDPTAPVDMDKLIAAVSRRVNPGGQKEVTIRRYGPEQIEIIIPDVTEDEARQLKAILNTAGNLEFRILANRRDDPALIERALKSPGSEVRDSSGRIIARWVPVKEGKEGSFTGYRDEASRVRTILGKQREEFLVRIDPYNVTGQFLANATRDVDEQGGFQVSFRFNSTGGQKFGELTSQNLPDKVQNFTRKLGIVLDNQLYSAPSIQSTIYDQGRITGQFSQEEVDALVSVLNAGALPASLSPQPLSENFSGPTLGSDTIQKSTFAMIVAAIAVPLFMLWYYRFAGIVADVALVLNILMLVALMISIKAAFTLTGFAALALTVGMAVDNNVLVFERLREELDRGATLRMAIRNAFHRASATVIDCNLTHLLAATVLFFIGSDQIKGFAVALWLGCAISMYTAVFVSHVIFDIFERQRWLSRLKMMHLIQHTNIDFMKLFPICAVISVSIIAGGLILAGLRGQGLFDIDFTGGVSVQVAFREPQQADAVREALAHLPDVAINDVRFQNEAEGKRFDINTSEQDLAKVRTELTTVFGAKLETNSVKLGKVTLITAGDVPADATGPAIKAPAAPAKPPATAPETSALKPPAAKPAEKAAAKPAEKPAEKPAAKPVEKPAAKPAEKPAAKPTDGKSSRTPLPGNHELALADDLPWLLAQATDAKPAADKASAKPASAKPASEKPAEKPAAKPAEKAAEKPAEKPAAKPAEKPAAETTPAPTAETIVGAFVGGARGELTFTHPVNHQSVVDLLVEALKATGQSTDTATFEASNPEFAEGSSKAFEVWEVKLQLPPEQAEKVLATLQKQVQASPFFPAANRIGAAVAGNTRVQAIYAIIASWFLIIAYLWIRFQRVAFGLAAVIALIHDVLVMLGGVAASYWLAQIPGVSHYLLIDQFKVNLPLVAAFLTIIGYSVNDTIVVFDRIREVRGKDPSLTRKMVNDSTNQTLSRTLLTSLTVMIVVFIMYVLGGQALRGFSFALIVGVLTGTFSSIYVAAPILLWLIGKPGPDATKRFG